MEDRNIGLIGTGIMGAPMGRRLLEAGFSLHVHNRTRNKADALIRKGAVWEDTPAALARGADIVISVVSDSPDVEAVYLGPGGVCQAVRHNALCIDMSTVAPETARKVAADVTERGAAFLDAPVSGGRTGAESGALSIMVGGSDANVARAQAVFDVLGKSIVHCGPVGNGQLTKLCNQILCGLNLLAVSEALVFAKRVGLDPETVLSAVSGGAAGSWALENLGPRMLSRDFAPMFMVDLQQKDLRIALRTAGANDTPLPGTALVSQLLTACQAAGHGREGSQILVNTLERLSGIA